ncbi:hypothetical protein SAMN05216436_10193 [bacterium A37T11]|nr:hypothetical protein SAMN05216436_10193 [bacterium A37T11]
MTLGLQFGMPFTNISLYAICLFYNLVLVHCKQISVKNLPNKKTLDRRI